MGIGEGWGIAEREGVGSSVALIGHGRGRGGRRWM